MNKKLLPLLFYLLMVIKAIAQFDPQLVPFYENKLWGYLDAKANVVIKPQFASALPFYKGTGKVYVNYTDTLFLGEEAVQDGSNITMVKKFEPFTESKQALIKQDGTFLIQPFIGEIELGENYFICRYGHLVWGTTVEVDMDGNPSGKENYFPSYVFDSSVVYNYTGTLLLPMKKGIYQFESQTYFSLKEEQVNTIGEVTIKENLFYKNKPLSVQNTESINCTDLICSYEIDSIITIIDSLGGSRNYKMSESERSYSREVLSADKIAFNWTDEYKVVNLNGEKIELNPLWYYDIPRLKAALEQIHKESWKRPIASQLSYVKDDKPMNVVDFGLGTAMLLSCKMEEDKRYVVLQKTNPNEIKEYYTRASKFMNGHALLATDKKWKMIDINGRFLEHLWQYNEIEWPINLTSYSPSFYNNFFIVSQNNERYFMDLGGKKYLVQKK